MKSSSDSNYDRNSVKFGNLSDVDPINYDVSRPNFYFHFEAPEQSCELFETPSNNEEPENDVLDIMNLNFESTYDKMCLCLEFTPN